MYIYLIYIYMCVYISNIYIYIYVSIYLFIYLSIHLSIYLFIYLSIYLSPPKKMKSIEIPFFPAPLDTQLYPLSIYLSKSTQKHEIHWNPIFFPHLWTRSFTHPSHCHASTSTTRRLPPRRPRAGHRCAGDSGSALHQDWCWGSRYHLGIYVGTLWLFNIAMGNGPFIDGLPIKNGDFPWLC